jgi:hypothetical protein
LRIGIEPGGGEAARPATIDDTLTIAAAVPSVNCPRAKSIKATGEAQLSCQVAAVSAGTPPTLFTSPSIPLAHAQKAAIKAAGAAGSARSAWNAQLPGQAATTQAAAACACTKSTPTIAPSLASKRAVEAPMPRAAPVTRIRRPWKMRDIKTDLSRRRRQARNSQHRAGCYTSCATNSFLVCRVARRSFHAT